MKHMPTTRKQFYASLVERVLWTFFQALAAFYITDGITDIDGLDNGDKFKAALIAAAISVAKNLLGAGVGNGSTPSWLPASLDPATPPNTDPDVNVVTGDDRGEVNIVVLCVIFVAVVVLLALLGVIDL